MEILISTNLFNTQEFETVFKLLERTEDLNTGVEIFPIWNNEDFEIMLKKNINNLKSRSISFHGPYYKTEHSAKIGTIEYTRTMDYIKKTLEYGQMLNSKYIVYHHNNKRVFLEEKIDMIKISNENLITINEMAKEYGQKIVVENCGIINSENMLFNEQEFIALSRNIPNDILIDIGHAHCNRWNLESLIEKLKTKITSYHIHNNYGRLDEHNRIYDGNINFARFMKIYKELTPNADLVLEYSPKWNEDLEGILHDISLIKELLLNSLMAS